MRESFIFYASFYEALQELPDNDRLTVYDAITRYSLTGQTAELSGVPKIIMTLIKPQLDANQKRYEDGCKGAEHGKRGGRPRKNPENPENPTGVISKNPMGIVSKTPLGIISETPNDNVNVNDNVNENVNENENTVPSREATSSLEISIAQVAEAATPIAIAAEISEKIAIPTAEIPIIWLYAWLRNKGEPYAGQVIKTCYDHQLRPPDVWIWLERYVNHINGCGQAYKTARDFQQHFINWLRIRLRETHTTEAVTVTDGKLPSGERDCPIPR